MDSIINNRHEILCNEKSNADASIIIVAYNRIEVTKECIDSVLRNTNEIKYKLILVFNRNEKEDGFIEFFNSVNYNDKVVIEIPENLGAPYAYRKISQYIEGKYIIHLPNDVIVTPNWLSNLIKCAESDDRIGMVNPVSSNVSNYQQVDLKFNNNDEMQIAAGKYNVSDPLKWFERMRLITLGTLFTRECLSAVGYIFDIGFTHDFGDDDISFRVRRAGYKAVLATDTWVHHSHENTGRKFYDLESGRKCFRDKYFGIDAWNDVNNYIPEVTNILEKPSETNEIAILGVDVKCGTPILEIKNKLRSFEIFEPESCAITSEGKYFIDLQTVCGADNVLAGSPDAISSEFEPGSFDYIIIGNNINEYPEPLKLLKKIYSLLKKGGQMFIYLKNTFDVYSFLNVIGFSQVMQASCSYNISVERFVELLDSNKIPAELISCIPYTDIPNEYIAEVNNRGAMFVKENIGITQTKLTCDKFLFKLSK